MAKYTKADIELQQARLAAFFGGVLDDDEAFAKTQKEGEVFRAKLEEDLAHKRALLIAEENKRRERAARKWLQNRARWNAWKKGEGK
jgi:hypothetical protein